MNSKSIASTIIAIAALSGASAFAQTGGVIYGESGNLPANSYTSNLTRAEVRADFVQARKDSGLPVESEAGVVVAKAAPTVASRAEVHAGAVQWVKAHPADLFFN